MLYWKTKTIRGVSLFNIHEVGQTLSTNFWVLLYAFFFHSFQRLSAFPSFHSQKNCIKLYNMVGLK